MASEAASGHVMNVTVSRSMVPREHGATTQLSLAIASALVVAGPEPATLLLGVAAAAVFVAHEPLLVWRGRRGESRRATEGGRALRFIAWLATVAAPAGLVGLTLAPAASLVWLVPPLGLGATALWLGLRGRERYLPVELLVAASFAWLAPALCAVGGAPLADALGIGLVWSLVFGLGTLAARSILMKKKDRGRGVSITRALSAATAVACAAAWTMGLAPAWMPLAVLPSAILVCVVSLRPPAPDRMAQVGVMLAIGAAAALPLFP